jgi:hypothetical protein
MTKEIWVRTFITFLFLLVFMNIAQSQIKIGLNGGINLASYTLSDKAPDVILQNKAGFSIGVIAEYYIIENLGIRLIAKYNQHGGENKIPSLSNIHNKIYYDYAELSPYLIYKVNDNTIIAKIIGGLSFGYLINSKVKSGDIEFDIKDISNRFNISSDIGLEIEIPLLEKNSLIINGIYSLGLMDISKSAGKTKTRNIQLGIGFLFSLL